MSTTPLLPSYSDDKEHPVMERKEDEEYDETRFEGLQVGQPSFVSRVKTRWNGLSKVKKGLALLLVFFGLAHFARGFFGHPPRHGRNLESWNVEDEDWKPSEKYWIVDEEDDPVAAGLVNPLTLVDDTTGTTTFNLSASHETGKHGQRGRDLAIDVPENIEASLIISKADDVEDITVNVESTWTGEAVPWAFLRSSPESDTIFIDDAEASHIIRLVLPQSARHVPRLHIKSPSGLPISLDSSAITTEPLIFQHIEIISDEGSIDLADDIVAEEVRLFTSSGDISGSYNVSRSIVLKTVEGDIKADVTVFPGRPHHFPGPPKGERPPPLGHGEHPGQGKGSEERPDKGKGPGKEDSDDSDRPEEKRDFKSKSSFLAGLFSHDKKKHGEHGEHGEHGDNGKHGEHGEHGKHRHPSPPPPPPSVGAFSKNGSIKLDVWPHEYPTHLSVIVKTLTENGNIFVHVSRFFKGLFAAETRDGQLDVGTGGNKTLEVVREVVSEKGHLLEGFIHPNGTEPHGPHGPHGPHHGDDKKGKKDKKGRRDEDRSFDDEEEQDVEEIEDRPSRPDEKPEGPSEPHERPGGHKGPGGEHKGPNDGHKGPDGGRDGPGGGHKGPGGPSPPGKGQHGGPHDGPHDPHGPMRPPPPGFGKVIAKTEKGDIKLRI